MSSAFSSHNVIHFYGLAYRLRLVPTRLVPRLLCILIRGFTGRIILTSTAASSCQDEVTYGTY
jgi:hypothetical protein